MADELESSTTRLTLVGPDTVSRSTRTRLPSKERAPWTWTPNVPFLAVRLASTSMILGRTFTVTVELVAVPHWTS